ncbi:sulfur carrier protein ThiS adenylyltransferase ThiF [Helicovermis profundi]|uniref:THIF-type NAD/FAD binding fold domain-containing protein n=1 Tax=Helicovermis profundi TaxID=3065157 RepID=A0AAU9ECC8_9FIRM|nr:hypothetical protein HLPR_19380 [Clostridia bacterium S502]
MINLKNSDELIRKYKKVSVAVLGLGGLGSNIAMMLVRSGIDRLIIYDFDNVELSNLNRQNYYINDVGNSKVKATSLILKNINPNIKIIGEKLKLSLSNFERYLSKADIIVEAFDSPICKAELANWVLGETDKILISASGMAGFGDSNDILTKKKSERFYISGDFVSDSNIFPELLSARVMMTASHEANNVMNIIKNNI